MNKVIIRTSNNDGMNCKNLNVKQKWRQKWKQQRQKSKCSRKMKKKIAIMIMNATKGYPTSEEDTIRDNATKEVLKTIHWRRLRMPNQWPDYST